MEAEDTLPHANNKTHKDDEIRNHPELQNYFRRQDALLVALETIETNFKTSRDVGALFRTLSAPYLDPDYAQFELNTLEVFYTYLPVSYFPRLVALLSPLIQNGTLDVNAVLSLLFDVNVHRSAEQDEDAYTEALSRPHARKTRQKQRKAPIGTPEEERLTGSDSEDEEVDYGTQHRTYGHLAEFENLPVKRWTQTNESHVFAKFAGSPTHAQTLINFLTEVYTRYGEQAVPYLMHAFSLGGRLEAPLHASFVSQRNHAARLEYLTLLNTLLENNHITSQHLYVLFNAMYNFKKVHPYWLDFITHDVANALNFLTQFASTHTARIIEMLKHEIHANSYHLSYALLKHMLMVQRPHEDPSKHYWVYHRRTPAEIETLFEKFDALMHPLTQADSTIKLKFIVTALEHALFTQPDPECVNAFFELMAPRLQLPPIVYSQLFMECMHRNASVKPKNLAHLLLRADVAGHSVVLAYLKTFKSRELAGIATIGEAILEEAPPLAQPLKRSNDSSEEALVSLEGHHDIHHAATQVQTFPTSAFRILQTQRLQNLNVVKPESDAAPLQKLHAYFQSLISLLSKQIDVFTPLKTQIADDIAAITRAIKSDSAIPESGVAQPQPDRWMQRHTSIKTHYHKLRAKIVELVDDTEAGLRAEFLTLVTTWLTVEHALALHRNKKENAFAQTALPDPEFLAKLHTLLNEVEHGHAHATHLYT